jgi:hypothetical protein
MGVSGGDSGLPEHHDRCMAEHMHVRLRFVTPLLGAAAAAVAIVAAPIAAAAPTPAPAPAQQNCSATGPGTICQSPGNVQLNDAPPPVQFYPYGGEALLL